MDSRLARYRIFDGRISKRLVLLFLKLKILQWHTQLERYTLTNGMDSVTTCHGQHLFCFFKLYICRARKHKRSTQKMYTYLSSKHTKLV